MFRVLIVAVAVVACAAPVRPTVLPPGSIPASFMLRQTALDLLHVKGDGVCEAAWIQPAFVCARGFEFDGCRWRCVRSEDRQ